MTKSPALLENGTMSLKLFAPGIPIKNFAP